MADGNTGPKVAVVTGGTGGVGRAGAGAVAPAIVRRR